MSNTKKFIAKNGLQTDNIHIDERAAAEGAVAGTGQFWVKNDSPNVPYFTDDAGTDHNLLAASSGPEVFIQPTEPTTWQDGDIWIETSS